MLPPKKGPTLSLVDDAPDSQAVTVRTPNAAPLEAPVVLTRDGRVIEEAHVLRSPYAGDTLQISRSPASTMPMSGRPVPSRLPLSLRAPASRANEAMWFEKEPLVAPGVAEMPEPLSASLAPTSQRGSRGAGFAMVAVLLVGIAAAGSVFFLTSAPAKEAKAPDQASTTQVTNADLKPALPVAPPPPPAPEPTVAPAPPPPPVAKPIKTVRTADLPSTPSTSYEPEPKPAPRSDDTETTTSTDVQENR